MPLLPLLAFHHQHMARQSQPSRATDPMSAPTDVRHAATQVDAVPPGPSRLAPPGEAPCAHTPFAPQPAPRATQVGRLLAQHVDDVAGNLVFSPYAAWTSLTSLYAGAAGQTAQQLAPVLSLAPDASDEAAMAVLHQVTGRIDPTLDELPLGHVATSLWLDATRPMAPVFRARMDRLRDFPVQSIELSCAPSRAAADINAWGRRVTGGQVASWLSPDELSASRGGMLLLSSIHIEALWQRPFEPEQASTTFHDEDGDCCEVRMLRRVHHDAYYEAPHFSAVCVPLQGGTLQMEFALPHEGRAWRDALLDGRWMSGELPWSRERRIALALPPFAFDSTLELTQALRHGGLSAATDPSTADFRPMTEAKGDSARGLYLGGVWQKAIIVVDAQGTCAAALTAQRRALPVGWRAQPAIPLRLQRPFLFLMRHMATQEVLFVGKVGLVSALTQAPPEDVDYLSDDEDSASEQNTR